jgi:hypothetical protein
LLVPLLAGCDDVKYTDYFEGEVDSDVGQGTGGDIDAGNGAEQLVGDPCGDENPWSCDPNDGAGCGDGGLGCDYGLHEGVFGFFCFTDATEPIGAPCAVDAGPWCAGGATCHEGLCAAYCCGDGDCAEGVCDALPLEYVEGPLGICL